jgi:hypothetical protein
MASRYDGIARHLAQQPGPTYTAAFRVVAQATGHPRLRNAAYTRPLWWTNDPAHPQARHGWPAAGWQVETVDLARQVVTFRRSRSV